MKEPTPTQKKVTALMARYDVSRATFAAMLGVDDTTVDAWVDGKRELFGLSLIVIDMLTDCPPDHEFWLAERHKQMYGVAPKKKGYQRGGRKRKAVVD
jgi:plasmid maintenance system antidote protein VapI